jgi:outer membrane protein
LLTGNGASASPAPPQELIAAYTETADGERVNILISLAKSGNPDLAEYLLQQFPLQGKFAANRTLFVQGLVFKARGNLTGSVKNYRAALANDPTLTLVRSELAQTLHELGEDESAIHHLKLLQSEAPDAEAAAGIKSFIDRIDADTPYKFNAYVAAAPTTNVNNGSIRNVVYLPGGWELDISEPSKRKSGLGVAAGANGSYSKRLGNQLMAVVSGGIDGRLYDHSDFNAVTLSQSAELRALNGNGYVSLGAIASQSLSTDSIDYDYLSYGPRVSLRHSLTHQDLLNLSATFEFREYANDTIRDGTALLVNGAWTHIFDSSFSTTLSAGYSKVNVDNDVAAANNAYETFSAGLGFYKELPRGITINTGIDIQMSEFDGKFLTLFDPREDLRAAANISLTKRDFNIFGFAPSIEYTYTWNDSNYGIYDYDAHAVDLRLTKEF